MKVCYFINSKNEFKFIKQVRDFLKTKNIYLTLVYFDKLTDNIYIDDDEIYHLSKVNSKEGLKLFSSFNFNIIEVSIFSELYFFAFKMSRKFHSIFLVDCHDFSATFNFPKPVKKSSTILSYTYYQIMLNFVDYLLVNSLVGKKRIEDMGLNKKIYTLSPCYDYFYINKEHSDSSFRLTKGNDNCVLIDTTLFSSDEIIDFINQVKKYESIIPCIIIDTSTTDFSSLYSIDQKYIFSTKDFNRNLIYRNATYLYSHQNKIDDYDLLLANKMNLPIINSLNQIFSQNSLFKNQTISDNKFFVEKEYTFEKFVNNLMEIYDSLGRRNY